MPSDSNAIEDTFLVTCARELLHKHPYSNLKALGRAIHDANPLADAASAEKAVKRQHFDGVHSAEIANGAAALLAKHFGLVAEMLAAEGEPESLAYLKAVLSRRVEDFDHEPPKNELSAAEEIFRNWSEFSRKSSEDHGNLVTPSVYQLIRRYKPIDLTGAAAAENAYQDPEEHHVVMEICYLDEKQSLLITSELKVYSGTVFINNERILNTLMQRRRRRFTGFNHRFISLKLHPNRLKFYSGLCMKVGDTTMHPIATECIFVEVFAKDHPELHKAVLDIVNAPSRPRIIEDAGIFANYIVPSPSPAEAAREGTDRTMRVKDVPNLAPLVRRRGKGTALFREPSRTLDFRDIAGAAPLEVYRHPSTSS